MANSNRIVTAVPVAELGAVADGLLHGGVSFADAVDEVAALADALVDWTKVIPGPIGELVESQDGPVARRIASAIVRAAERRRARKAA